MDLQLIPFIVGFCAPVAFALGMMAQIAYRFFRGQPV